MSEDKKSITVELNLWQREDGQIALSWEDQITTVNNTEGSKRCHPNMFDKLQATLRAHGKWSD